ncbi:hypothetical protein AJ78_06551 [Emergomyces pasteurianus Ep9510]|uniref:Transcription factor domain-containing protein n=1 Tax=Emergomyces pasteurianus Ep9510 TaxID=1447872 RepID=A0A1J9QAH4_9EURO|nr:hypothetical protein AJ78_06551 [Emergomyces pasteurianus Ep9510]
MPDQSSGDGASNANSYTHSAEPAPAPNPNLEDLELMMNWYHLDIHNTLSTNSECKSVWQDALRRESLSHPFLMHGILALSALNLACRSGGYSLNVYQRPYITVALSHHSQAVALFQPFLENIDEHNSKAIFLHSILLTVFAFGSPEPQASMTICRSIDQFHLVLLLSRGMQQAFCTATDWIDDNEFKTIIKPDDYTPCLPDDAKAALRKLRQINESCEQYTVCNEKNAYSASIDQVQFTLEQIHGGARRPNPAVTWAVKVPPLYLELMRAYKPMALVVLAYYCVILHHLREIWWVSGWSVPLLRAIWSSLDDEWRKPLRWVLEVTGFAP